MVTALTEADRLRFNKVHDQADPEMPWNDPDGGEVQADSGGAMRWVDPDEYKDIADAIEGAEGLGMSGAGGEFRDTLEAAMHKEQETAKKKRAPDRRIQRDRTKKQVEAFAAQMEAITDVYLKWSHLVGDTLDGPIPSTKEESEGTCTLTVVDIFDSFSVTLPTYKANVFDVCSVIWQGAYPSAPYNAQVAFSTRTLELFRLAHVRAPGLSIQKWVKTLFSVAYDVYLGARNIVAYRVKHVLGRDAPNWRAANCCDACMYKLEGELPLEYPMLVTMDGNDSLKRVLQKEPKDYDEEGNLLPGVSKERFDPRAATAGKDYFIPHDKVNLWAKDKIKEQCKPRVEEKSACEERWKNLAEDSTKKMWGVYDETGIFLMLCRHSFVLWAIDMIRSGELSKYPLALLAEVLQEFPAGTGCGYNTGCGTATTLWNSPLGMQALLQKLRLLVGAFHGHGHNRLLESENARKVLVPQSPAIRDKRLY
ncbi:hypothetical protein B0H16DRAFT_1820304 [Mycena metata]|uniref:CxC1-like cysteine cluster associated with KDZ transposases domain-containing protein n=1 Tax=Mycena metata TaxID=1033252 RepID=A0AAD7H3K6_9AGAR|nr:hypothetical protein B0H16DRAFT_1820304 [Mycena metata]